MTLSHNPLEAAIGGAVVGRRPFGPAVAGFMRMAHKIPSGVPKTGAADAGWHRCASWGAPPRTRHRRHAHGRRGHLEFADQPAWERWLDEHHGQLRGVWLTFAKKGSPTATVTYDEALEVALCFGWIDGQVARYDASFYLQRFTPRRARSKWSQLNRDRAEALIASGRMRPGQGTTLRACLLPVASEQQLRS